MFAKESGALWEVGGRDRRSALAPAWTWLASVLMHASIAILGGWIALRSVDQHKGGVERSPPRDDAPIAIDLPIVAEGTLLAARPPDIQGIPPVRSGGDTVARLDTGTSGRGGDVAVDAPAIHLSDRDERMRLATELLSRLDRDETQRIRSSSTRASWEDRRATTHPGELTFVTSGRGERPEHRVFAAVDPSRGALSSPEPSVRGGDVGTPDPVGGDAPRSDVGGRLRGGLDAAPGHGVKEGRTGEDHRTSADVARMRPDVAHAPVAVPAANRGRVRDDVDSQQEVATVLRALVHASTAGGLSGGGRGGDGEGGDPGAGGLSGPGSHPQPLGDGSSDWFDINTADPRLVPYFRRVHARIEPLWADAFPKSAMMDLKQGTVILEFTIFDNGAARVTWPPLRPSGIDEFDRNCADAIRRAGPFEPIPRELARGSLRIRAPFVASSPLVPY
jgi:TonB family protein